MLTAPLRLRSWDDLVLILQENPENMVLMDHMELARGLLRAPHSGPPVRPPRTLPFSHRSLELSEPHRGSLLPGRIRVVVQGLDRLIDQRQARFAPFHDSAQNQASDKAEIEQTMRMWKSPKRSVCRPPSRTGFPRATTTLCRQETRTDRLVPPCRLGRSRLKPPNLSGGVYEQTSDLNSE